MTRQAGWRAPLVVLGLLAAPGLAVAAMGVAERLALLAPTASFTAAERFEGLPGGTTTDKRATGRDVFSQPAANLSFPERADFAVGNGFFRRDWVGTPASTTAGDGLGPLYNARACQACHVKDGRGRPPGAGDVGALSMLLRLSVPPSTDAERARLASLAAPVIPDPVYGGQLQDLAVPGQRAEGQVRVAWGPGETVTLAGGAVAQLQRPVWSVGEPAFGPLPEDLMISPRVAPPMIGLGLLEAIPEADILAREDPEDRDGDGISGRANRVWSAIERRPALGRFGWKASEPDLAQQNGHAMANDIGLSNAMGTQPWGECTATEAACRAGPHGAAAATGLEAGPEIMDAVLFYSRTLAVPARPTAGEPAVLDGKRVFYQLGCTGCHAPKQATAADWPVRALKGQLIWPYTDLLLHDLGEGLGDGRPDGLAGGQEWRTAPLWGLGRTLAVSGHTRLLHDGRARDVTEAVLWHGGEAMASREGFRALPEAERSALLAFLASL